RALEPASLGVAIRALRAYAPRGPSVLEVRADAARVALQVRVGESATVAEYSYDGRVLGPVPIHLDGEGELGANLFDLDTVDWDALGKLFPRARDAVDPLDGRVTGLVVRRHLPFSADVRARLYVASPRMTGHLDADARGTELSTPPAAPSIFGDRRERGTPATSAATVRRLERPSSAHPGRRRRRAPPRARPRRLARALGAAPGPGRLRAAPFGGAFATPAALG